MGEVTRSRGQPGTDGAAVVKEESLVDGDVESAILRLAGLAAEGLHESPDMRGEFRVERCLVQILAKPLAFRIGEAGRLHQANGQLLRSQRLEVRHGKAVRRNL